MKRALGWIMSVCSLFNRIAADLGNKKKKRADQQKVSLLEENAQKFSVSSTIWLLVFCVFVFFDGSLFFGG